MQSDQKTSEEFLLLAKKISIRDKAIFDSLMEFEKTKKIRTKERLNFTIDSSLANNFRKHCKQKGYNMSSRIEDAMRRVLKDSD